MAETLQQPATTDAAQSSARLLMVDVEGAYLSSTVQQLREAGYHCDGVDDVSRGKELLLSELYDLLITDINLSDGQGVGLIEHAQMHVPGLPVIVVTDSPCLDSAIQSIEMSVVAYLAKSESPSVLVNKIRGALVGTETNRALLRIQKRLQQCVFDLADARNHRGNPGGDHDSRGVRIPISTLQALAGCLGELVGMEAATDANGQLSRVCDLLQCPIWRVQRQAIHKCILLLHETKRRFKSKELAQVREILEGLLKTFT